MKARLILLLFVLVLASLIGYRLVQKRSAAAAQTRQRAARMKTPPTVTFALSHVQDVSQGLDSVGSVEAPLSVSIAAKLTGRIEYLQVHEGDRIATGQALVRTDPTQVEAEVRQAEASLAEAQYRLAQAKITQNPTDVAVASQVRQQQAALTSAQANLTDAQTKLNRLQTLYKQGYIAAQDVDDAKATVGVQQAAVDAARAALDYARANTAQKPAYAQSLAALRATVAVAQAGVKSAQAQRADTVLTAPFDGFVTKRYLDPGAVVTAGQAILAVQYMRQVWVTVSVPEEVGGRIRLGQMGEVSLDALPGRTFTGKVTQVNPSADPASRQFSVRLTLDNPDFTIRPGTFAHVYLQTEVVHDALVVPREAVQHDRDGDYVLVIDDQSVVQHRPVTLGVPSVAVIAITNGLRPGEKVVTLAAYPLKDGQAVSTGGEKSGKSGRSHGR